MPSKLVEKSEREKFAVSYGDHKQKITMIIQLQNSI